MVIFWPGRGVSRQTINTIEKNKYLPSTLLALKMSAFFRVTGNELIMLEEADWRSLL